MKLELRNVKDHPSSENTIAQKYLLIFFIITAH